MEILRTEVPLSTIVAYEHVADLFSYRKTYAEAPVLARVPLERITLRGPNTLCWKM